jgi:Leucine-rich repeat (LRR) protein
MIPDTLGQLVNLRILGLSDNELCAIPQTIGQLTNLHNLDVSDNGLRYVPESFKQLTNLEMFRINRRQLKLFEGLVHKNAIKIV